MKIAIVTPAAAHSRYGNRNTAVRWARMLRELGHQVTVQQVWSGRSADLLLALHARRSHDSIVRYAERHPERPLVLALTGTDLYRDIRDDINAQESLDLATRLVVLQDMGLRELAPRLRRKAGVVYQSSEPVRRMPPNRACFEIVISGHLREEKDPFRGAEALSLLPAESRIRITHIGGARDREMAAAASRWMKKEPRYVWLGELAHRQALATLARARLMLISSWMEGGANVVSEALAAGVPVIGSKISGNIGMLGGSYRGYYPAGDARALAKLLRKAESDAGFLATLRRQCAARRPLISATREKRSLRAILAAASNT